MVKVLIVDDSITKRILLRALLEADPDIEVAGQASSGPQALQRVASLRPDVVTMDIYMPGMDGYETTRQMMQENPVPIVIVSSTIAATKEQSTFRAIEAGALAAVASPAGPVSKVSAREAAELTRTIKEMSCIKVTARKDTPRDGRTWGVRPKKLAPAKVSTCRVVAIGASTGGPPALKTILSGLPPDFLVPVLVVQHISKGFLTGMASWLNSQCAIMVKIAEDREPLSPGRVYLAPEEHHLGISAGSRIRLSNAPARNGHRPSVDALFQSVNEALPGRAIGVLLTGMGSDGAASLGSMRASGCMTIAQDRESSTVHGMPGEAIKLGHATHVMSPSEISRWLGEARR